MTVEAGRKLAYILYYLFARHLPRSYEWGFLGELSKRMRATLCHRIIVDSHPELFVERGADFGGGRNLITDEFACIGENARFIGEGNIKIGKHVMMGPDVMIITTDHKMEGSGFKGYVSADVEIGDYAWIGARTIILKGVKIGAHAVIGAGALVVKDVEPYSIAVGNPAKVVKKRIQLS